MIRLTPGMEDIMARDIRLVQTGGIHYNNKWNDDKQSINGNYKMLQLNVNGVSSTRIRIYFTRYFIF